MKKHAGWKLRTILLLLLAILSLSSFVWESWVLSGMIRKMNETPSKMGICNILWNGAREAWRIAATMKDSMPYFEQTLERYQQNSNSYASVVAELRKADDATILRLHELSKKIAGELSSNLGRMSVEQKIDLSSLLSFIDDLAQSIKVSRLTQYNQKSLPYFTTLVLHERMTIITAELNEIQNRNREGSYTLHRTNVVSGAETLLKQSILVCATLAAGIFALREIVKIWKNTDRTG